MESALFAPLALPCGVVLKNRIAKAAMSDSLGDGRGNPTDAQIRLYERWAQGGAALSIVGEVQGNPDFAEKPGNLVLAAGVDPKKLSDLADAGAACGSRLWLQLGHAGALAHRPISDPRGPSALDLPELTCQEFTSEQVRALPGEFAQTAQRAQALGFGGVEVHAAHGFLLSQFLSPLFNHRSDEYGGTIANRMRTVIDVVAAIRDAVGPSFPIGIKLNSSDQLEGGLTETESLQIVTALEQTTIDVIDISGGTYFPGARAATDSGGSGAYFLRFAQRARSVTSKPLMLTGGFKTREQAERAVGEGIVDLVGFARALALQPDLPNAWRDGSDENPRFPRFDSRSEGGVTAWYSMLLTDLGLDRRPADDLDLDAALKRYNARDEERVLLWQERFAR